MSWLRRAETAMLQACAASLGIAPGSREFNQRFRVSYPDQVTTPQAGLDRSVCYLTISEVTDQMTHYVQGRYGRNSDGVFGLMQEKTIPLQCLLTFYGKNADEDAENLWSRIMTDVGAGSPRDILRSAHMVPVGFPDRPVSLPELEGSLWRRRCDVRMRMNMLVTDFIPAHAIEHAPEIEYRKG